MIFLEQNDFNRQATSLPRASALIALRAICAEALGTRSDRQESPQPRPQGILPLRPNNSSALTIFWRQREYSQDSLTS
jgi:hypothetical protein